MTDSAWKIILLSLGLFASGLAALWILARRELRRGSEESQRRRPWLRQLEDRVLDLLEQPPSWQQIAARLRPLAFSAAVGAVVGTVAWVIWAHGAEWFSAATTPPTPPRPSIHSGLPFESAVKQIEHGLSSMAPALIIMSMLIAGYHAIVGERTRALGVVFASSFLFLATRILGSGADPSELTPPAASAQTPAEGPVDVQTAPAADTAPTSEEALPPDQVAELARQFTGSEPLPASSMPPQATHSDGHSAESSSDTGFGVGDALMAYGAYKLLTGSSSGPAPVPAAAPATRPRPPLTAAPASTHESSPAPAPSSTAVPRSRPASASPTFGVRSRLMSRPTFRSGRR
jgi:hypothetical protein